MVMANSRVQAISYAKAVLPTTANRKSRKRNENSCGVFRSGLTFRGKTLAGGEVRFSFDAQSAISPASAFTAAAQPIVTRRPHAGSRTNPAIKVPATAPRVFTQYNWLTPAPRLAELREKPSTRIGNVAPIRKVGINSTAVTPNNLSASRGICAPLTTGYTITYRERTAARPARERAPVAAINNSIRAYSATGLVCPLAQRLR